MVHFNEHRYFEISLRIEVAWLDVYRNINYQKPGIYSITAYTMLLYGISARDIPNYLTTEEMFALFIRPTSNTVYITVLEKI